MACTYCVTSLSDHKRVPDELKTEQMLRLVRMLKDYAGIEKVRLTRVVQGTLSGSLLNNVSWSDIQAPQFSQ